MAPIYTKQFYVALLPAGATAVIYTVQPGEVAVLRDIELQCAQASDFVAIAAGAINVVLLAGKAVGPYFWGQWTGRIALGAGNSFSITSHAAESVGVAVTGYLFRT